MTTIDNYPEVRQAEQETDLIAERVAALKVVSPESFEQGSALLRQVKAAQVKLESLRTAITKPMNEALRAANALFRGPADRLESMERTLKSRLALFHQSEERKRVEAEMKARDDTRKERERIEAEARAARRKASNEAAKLRGMAAAAAASGAHETAQSLEAKAEAALERGGSTAEALDRGAATIVMPTIEPTLQKQDGISMRMVMRFEVFDPKLVPDEYKMIDKTKIRRIVNALKLETKIAGVRVWEEADIAAKAAEDSVTE